MKPSRSTRRWLSSLLVIALLFTQYAVAAYVCAGLQGDAGSAATGIQAMADMPGCTEMSTEQLDPAQPLLCKAHCSHDGQSVQSVHDLLSPDLAAALLIAIVDWPPRSLQAHTGTMSLRTTRAPTGPPHGWPPLYLALQILRN